MKDKLKTLKLNYMTINNDGYKEATESFNRAIKKNPLAVVFCENENDVAEAIKWVTSNNIEFRIRSGRHHYEGYSIVDDGVVIDISKINNIHIDEENKTIKIGGGTRNRELYEALNRLNYPFPGGGCPTVGVAGFTLGGGWGYSSRMLGLGCDSLLELEIINYKGEKLIANSEVNSELFWACRGAGSGNFGVITALTFSIPSKVEKVTLINFDCPNTEKEEIISLALSYQKVFRDLDKRANFKLAMYNSETKGYGAKITGLYYGKKEEAYEILKPFIKEVSNINLELKYTSIFEANELIQDSHPDFEKYKSGGRFILKDLTKDELLKIFEVIKDRAKGAYYTAVTLYGLGGVISEVKKDETAFYYRDAKFILGFQTVWEDDLYEKDNIEWFRERIFILKDFSQGAFINFPTEFLENYKKDYYGKNIQKLLKVKEIYDPNNTFKFEQGLI